MDRKYWIVSPNVNNRSETQDKWLQAIPPLHAAFMGWPPQKHKGDPKGLGLRFAQEVDFGDVVLIAGGSNVNKQLLGCGIVASEALVKRPKGLPRQLTFGSYRLLDRFKKLKNEPSAYPGLSFKGAAFGSAQQLPAIYQLKPEANKTDRKICGWLDAQLDGRNYPTEKEADEDEQDNKTYFEDPTRFVIHKSIERNAALAKRVKQLHGYECEACGFRFERFYAGIENNQYIEAHHLQPLSALGTQKPVRRDPRRDFAVLCANCHRMVHRTKNPGDLKSFMRAVKPFVFWRQR